MRNMHLVLDIVVPMSLIDEGFQERYTEDQLADLLFREFADELNHGDGIEVELITGYVIESNDGLEDTPSE